MIKPGSRVKYKDELGIAIREANSQQDKWVILPDNRNIVTVSTKNLEYVPGGPEIGKKIKISDIYRGNAIGVVTEIRSYMVYIGLEDGRIVSTYMSLNNIMVLDNHPYMFMFEDDGCD